MGGRIDETSAKTVHRSDRAVDKWATVVQGGAEILVGNSQRRAAGEADRLHSTLHCVVMVAAASSVSEEVQPDWMLCEQCCSVAAIVVGRLDRGR